MDLSATAIERARALAAALGLANVELQRADLTALPELGTFDYVIAHGVYSWIAPPRRATRCSPPAARTWRPAASPTSPTT